MPVKRVALLPLVLALLTGFLTPLKAEPHALDQRDPRANEQKADALVDKLQQLRARVDASSRKVSLEEAIELGLRNNPDLVSAFRTIQDYEWQLIAAQRQWYPTLELSNGSPFVGLNANTYIQRFYNSQQEQVISTLGSAPNAPSQVKQFTTTAVLQPGATASWSFIDPTRQPNINAASEALRQQKLLFDVSARNLILQIQTAYYTLQSTRQLIADFQQIYDINRRQMEVIRARYGIQLATVLDLAQTESQLFNQLNQLVSFTQSYITEAAQLARQLGLPDDSLVLPAEKAKLYNSWMVPLPETIARATRLREEILASLAAAESAQWSGIAQMNQYLPVFQVVGTGSLQLESGVINGVPGRDTTFAQSGLKTWNGAVGIGFNWTLFDGGIDAAQAQSEYAQAEQKRSVAESNRLQTVQQIRSSYGDYEASQVAVDSARMAYQAALTAQEAARARFDIGVGDITTIVQTIEQWGTSSQQLSQAILAYNKAVAELYRFSATWPGDSGALVREQEQRLR